MHPILANQERLSIYLLGWLIFGSMLASVLALSHDFSWTEGLTLALPITIIYGIICLSSWYVCRVYNRVWTVLGRNHLAHETSSG